MTARTRLAGLVQGGLGDEL